MSMQQSQIFSNTSNNIRVSAQPTFMPEQSIIPQSLYFWAYSIQIENFSENPVQLIKRQWQIIDSNGDVIEVSGAGVVGKVPIIKPNERYQYASGTYLKTPSGMMVGSYTMRCSTTRREFKISIPTFSLDSPFELHRPT